MLNFTAVMVTYADRALFVKQVVESCIAAGCNSIFIIDNGSAKNSKLELSLLKGKYDFIHVEENDENMGSAFAFGQAMDLAASAKNPNEHVLFLDDDNLAEESAIQNALRIYNEGFYENSVFFLYRRDRAHYVEYVRTHNETILTGKPNSFMTFTFSNFLKKILRRNSSLPSVAVSQDTDVIPVPCGPYGGMLTSRFVLARGMRPKKDMFVYFDDTDYSMSLQRSGIKLYLITSCVLHDIDNSWTNEKMLSRFSSPLLEGPEYKVKYSVRNRVYFERKYLVKSKSVYTFNMLCFLVITLVRAILTLKMKRFIHLIKYVFEGFRF